MKTLFRNILLMLVVLVLGTAAALAQPGGLIICNMNGENCIPIPPPGSCWPAWAPLLPGVNSIISGDSLPHPHFFNLSAPECAATFSVVTPGPCCPIAFQPRCPNCWTCPGAHPILGAFTWSIVCPNTCPMSTQNPSCIPPGGTAIVDLYFNVTGTIGMFPGRTFTSATCIHVRGIVRSCNPFRCEVFTLVNGPIPFNDQLGNFAFNLDCLAVVLNG
jgi:hypothetical protein